MLRAERGEQRGGPGPGHEAYRVGLVEAAGGVHRADGAGGAGADGGDGGVEMKAGAGAAGGISQAMRSGNGVGIAAMGLVGGERDIFK